MSYSNFYLKKDKFQIPTAAFLVVIILVGVFMAKMFVTQPITSRATKKTLKRISTVNLSYNQATVYWQTEKKEIGWLVYGDSEKKLDQIAFDERDTKEAKGKYLNHYVILKNLKENHIYYFKIVSDNQLVADASGDAYKLQTTLNISAASNVKPAYGKVLAANGSPLTSGVVILSFDGAMPLFGLVKLSGEWMIPLNSVLDETTKKIKIIEDKDVGLIEIFSEKGEKTSIEITAKNLSPLPQSVIIGKNYNFLTEESVLGLNDYNINSDNKISIIYPKQNSAVPSAQPLIKGLAVAEREVVVFLRSKQNYSFRTTADKNGIWKVDLVQTLPAGNYEMELVTKDAQNKEVKLKRTFTIAKSGEQVMGLATPEATLDTPTPEPTQIVASSTPVPTIKKAGFDPLPLSVISGSLIIVGIGIILAF